MISRAIAERQVVEFHYERERVKAEPYLLGTHRRTGAYLLLAYVTGPEPEGQGGWRRFRYSLIRDFVQSGVQFAVIREGVSPELRRGLGGVITPVHDPRSYEVR